jgi:hypothetical protein
MRLGGEEMQTHVAVQRRVTSYMHAEPGRDSDLRDGRYFMSTAQHATGPK